MFELASDPKSSSNTQSYTRCENGASLRKLLFWRISYFFYCLKASIQQNCDVWACLRPKIIFLYFRLYHKWKWDFFQERNFFTNFHSIFLQFLSFIKVYRPKCVSNSKSSSYTLSYIMCVNGTFFPEIVFMDKFSYNFQYFQGSQALIQQNFYV